MRSTANPNTTRQTAFPPPWIMARMLFRLALHGFRLGRLETYGGFFYDDQEECP